MKVELKIHTLGVFGKNRSVPILEETMMTLEGGKIYGIVGDNGIGKSTLLRSFAGLNQGEIIQENGSLTIDNISYPLGSENLLSLNQNEIAFFFQQVDSAFDPRKKMNFYFSHHTSLNRNQIEELLKEFQFQDPSRVLNSYPHQLSGGEKQRIAMALIKEKSSILSLYDEPFAALDGKNIEIFINIIKEQKKQGKIAVISSHIEGPLQEIADELFLLDEGRLVLLENEEITKANEQSVRLEEKNSAEIVVIEDVSFSYNPQEEIISQLNLTIKSFDFILLTGVSGSGKSTFLKIIAGLLRPKEGTVYEAVTGKSMYQLVRKEVEHGNPYHLHVDDDYYVELVQLVSQDPFTSLPPYDCFEEIIKDLGLWKENETRIHDFCEQMEISDTLLRSRMTELSGGQRQLLYILINLLFNPKILLLDEAFSSLASAKSSLLLDYLLKFQSQNGTAIVYVTHQYQDVLKHVTKHIKF